ncbi:MAG: hypothetical protein ACE5MH_09925, partial [Terriglobia bacterium]
TPEYEIEAAARASLPRWAAILLVLIAGVLVFVAYTQWSTRTELSAQLEQANHQLARLEARTVTLEDNYATLRGQFDVTSERLGLTQKELARARGLARQIREEQKQAVAALDTELDTLRSKQEKQETQVGSLVGAVTNVRGDVDATRRDVTELEERLERAIGDLGVQSGLIATNAKELGELKRRGERNYIEFNIKKSRRYTRVGSISVRLRKTNTKRQQYTINLLADDKRIEKKNKTLLEPVQFYLKGTRHMLELVVYDIQKNRIVGYLSAPKELASRSP